MDRRTFISLTLASAVTAKSFPRHSDFLLRPEDFGARGDGVTNDTPAFGLVCDRIRQMGGGTIELAPNKTYVVGIQHRGHDRAFTPDPILSFEGLRGPLAIMGNGARLRAASGLRFGSFDPVTAEPVRRKMPNFQETDRAWPYVAMILVRSARAPVTIMDLELDGNAPNLLVGGQWGDKGFQVPGSGVALYDNVAEEHISNLFSHHHPLDGVLVDGARSRTERSSVTHLVCDNNGRQGLSLVGGSGYEFEDCDFLRTGRSKIRSAPGAGVDIEAEDHKKIHDIAFIRCKFSDNAGPGLTAEWGDSSRVAFKDCKFVGTTNWAALPNRPGFTFDGCSFAGTVMQPHSSKVPAEAARFTRCRFTDNPALSPTGELFVAGKAGDGIVNLGVSDNVMFDECKFDLHHRGVLPWSWRAIYKDCRMQQASKTAAMTKGKFLGKNVIVGRVNLYGSIIVGTLLVNGKRMTNGPVGTDFAPW